MLASNKAFALPGFKHPRGRNTKSDAGQLWRQLHHCPPTSLREPSTTHIFWELWCWACLWGITETPRGVGCLYWRSFGLLFAAHPQHQVLGTWLGITTLSSHRSQGLHSPCPCLGLGVTHLHKLDSLPLKTSAQSGSASVALRCRSRGAQGISLSWASRWEGAKAGGEERTLWNQVNPPSP